MLIKLIKDLISGPAGSRPAGAEADEALTAAAARFDEHVERARFCTEVGDLSGAREALGAAARLAAGDGRPGSPALEPTARILATCLLAELELQDARPEAALALVAPELEAPLPPPRAALAAANALQALDRHDEALAILDGLPAAEAASGPARLARARSLAASGETAGAVREFRDIALGAGSTGGGLEAARAWAAAEPASEQAATTLGRSLAANGYPREAAEHLQASLARFPGAAPLLEAAADVHAAAGEWQPALDIYRRLASEQPEEASFLCRLGQCQKFLGDLAGAERTLEEAVSLDPALPRAHLERGLARFEQDDLVGALEDLRWAHIARRGSPWNHDFEARLQRAAPPPEAPLTARFKLLHDAEQLEYLADANLLPPAARDLADEYRNALEVQPAEDGRVPVARLSPEAPAAVAATLGKPLYVPLDAVPERSPINPALDTAQVQASYHASTPEVTFFDDFLTAEAHEALYRYCLETTTWNDLKNGYLGAYLHDGFCSGVLLRLARDLREQLPEIFGGLELVMLWGYKYDSRRRGIGMHADQARVNLNFWLTPDEANADPDSGGLVVYPWEPPPDLGAVRYNRETAAVTARLREEGVQPVVVPFRTNRAVVFNSKLYHHTDVFHFDEAYPSRRINVTMLFGHE